ncbi:hypothetical protein Nizo1840_1376 [Lactiplantibacillus plantarum]|nr:hypothetical protein Nizo1840_1376 [Lactiplantibacillus plantarum]
MSLMWRFNDNFKLGRTELATIIRVVKFRIELAEIVSYH